MEFKIYYSSAFIMDMFLMISAILLACLNFFSPVFKSGYLHYNYIPWLLIAIVKLFQYKKYIPFIFTESPIFTFNENYIHDKPNNIRYYWADVKAITKGYYLLNIWVYQPENYLSGFHNTIKRWRAKRMIKKGKSPYFINIDIIDANDNDLLAVLNEYRLASQNQTDNTTGEVG